MNILELLKHKALVKMPLDLEAPTDSAVLFAALGLMSDLVLDLEGPKLMGDVAVRRLLRHRALCSVATIEDEDRVGRLQVAFGEVESQLIKDFVDQDDLAQSALLLAASGQTLEAVMMLLEDVNRESHMLVCTAQMVAMVRVELVDVLFSLFAPHAQMLCLSLDGEVVKPSGEALQLTHLRQLSSAGG